MADPMTDETLAQARAELVEDVAPHCRDGGARLAKLLLAEVDRRRAELAERMTPAERYNARRPPLVTSAVASGRWVRVHTYSDNPDSSKAKCEASLVFRRPEEAAECARVLTAARKPSPGR